MSKFVEVRALAEVSVLELTGRRTSDTEEMIDEVAAEALATDKDPTLSDVMAIALQVTSSSKERKSRRGVA